MNIVLTGFMGTGKSAVAQELSKKLGWQHIDIDSVIEKDTGLKISDIFVRNGEIHFRDLETKAIKMITLLDRAIISTGGGAVLKEENMDALEKNGRIFCLTATSQKVHERTKNDSSRPLLNVGNPLEKIEELLKKRAHNYKRCYMTIDTSEMTVSQVAEKIIDSLK